MPKMIINGREVEMSPEQTEQLRVDRERRAADRIRRAQEKQAALTRAEATKSHVEQRLGVTWDELKEALRVI